MAAVTPGAQIGQTFTAASGSFTEVLQSLRQTTEVSLTAEIYSQASAAFGLGDGLSDVTDAEGNPYVLDQTFNDVDLVGRPLSVGNLVSSSTPPGLFVTATTNTYTPYLVIGDDALPDSQLPDAIIGQQYQEVLTNFPLASQILTGLFLNVTLGGAGTTSQTYTQTLVDRIGYAAREGLAEPESLSVNPSGLPVVVDGDAYTINVVAGKIDPDVGAALKSEMNAAESQLTASTSLSETQLSAIAVDLSIDATRAALLNFLNISALSTANLAAISGVVAYYDAPRVTISSNVIDASGESIGLNLAQDDIEAIAYPGENYAASEVFQSLYGLMEGGLEAEALPGEGGDTGTGIVGVFDEAAAQGIPILTLTSGEASEVANLSISAEAMARITDALEKGLFVFVPAASVTIDGNQTISWYQFDPTTGQLVDVSEDGAHQALVEYGADEATDAEEEAATIEPEIQGIAKLRQMQAELDEEQELIEQFKQSYEGANLLVNGAPGFGEIIRELIEGAEKGEQGLANTLAGVIQEQMFDAFLELFLTVDPPVSQAVSSLQMPAPLSPANVASSQVAESQGALVGAATAILSLDGVVLSGALFLNVVVHCVWLATGSIAAIGQRHSDAAEWSVRRYWCCLLAIKCSRRHFWKRRVHVARCRQFVVLRLGRKSIECQRLLE